MNLRRKKQLAARVLRVGKNRISFDENKLPEIKEAITKRDILDLQKDGIILIKEIKGRKKKKKRKTKRGPGKIKKKVNRRKQTYVRLTRKLRNYLKELRIQGKINNELYWDLRKKIRMKTFRSKAHLREYLETIEKIKIREIEPKAKKLKKSTTIKRTKKKTEKSKIKKLESKIKKKKKK